ncbi:tripartite tricarboxylate transporter permease [uncultured Roseobacter sp.]|uniref:tripartite tricarboxylate transporter permease n=1 Tax=uncultured Roseobacter sp. TaxID=114847 RepID=UPI002624C9A5|nr:tripartite tricarboxylate transporter permease [uncultured Roseobacter sp.]
MYGLIGYFGAAFIGRFITRIPTRVLYPIIFLTSFVAAYTSRGNLFDVYVMVAAGFAGWAMRKLDFNPGAFVISFVLAGGAEETFRQALLLSDNGLMIFVTRPVALLFLLIGIAALFFRVRSLGKQARAHALGDA